MGIQADALLQEVRELGKKQLACEDMMPFFKHKFAVILVEEYLVDLLVELKRSL